MSSVPAITDLSTSPPTVEQASYEDYTWPIDFTDLLAALPGSGWTIETPVCYLRYQAADVPLPDAAAVSGNKVTQRIRAGTLTGGQTYTLVATATVTGTTNVLATITKLVCPI